MDNLFFCTFAYGISREGRVKKLIFCILFCAIFANLSAEKNILTTNKEDGFYKTYCQKIIHCSNRIANEVIDDFIGQFRGNPDLLFEWALKDLGQQNDEEKDEVLLILKQAIFNPETGIGHIYCDIKVPGIKTFKDIDIESKVTKTIKENGSTYILVDIFHSNIFLKKAFGTFVIKPQSDGNQLFAITINVKFNWFFDLFITKKKYKSLIEWRAEGFVKNLKAEAERREKGL